MNAELGKGKAVLVSHLQGEELGVIESINLKSGKVLIYFGYEDCPHFTLFNIAQVRLQDTDSLKS
jgi:hypothetical protein